MFFRAAVLLPIISWSLRIRGFRATQAALQNFFIPSKKEQVAGGHGLDASRVETAERLARVETAEPLAQVEMAERLARVETAERLAQVEMAVRLVNAAARCGLGRSTCLEKSLALWWLLRWKGIASSVRIGARTTGGKFAAHAWVERDGVALNEPREEHRHYATFDAAFSLQSSERT